jgi:predicted phage-related endonuclease
MVAQPEKLWSTPGPMKRITHAYTTREAWLALRRKNINSTECAALFGLSPYQTALELALTKAGKIDEEVIDNDRTTWGQRLQAVIADGVIQDYGVNALPSLDYIEMEGLRIGSSFDYEIFSSVILPRAEHEAKFGALNELQRYAADYGPGLLEVKNLDGRQFANDWHVVTNEDGEKQLEAAPHIEIQLQHQMMVRGVAWGAIAVLVNGNSLKILLRMADEVVHAMIVKRCAALWADIAVGKFPPADLPADADVLKRLYNFGEPGTFYDGTGDELLAKACAEYTSYNAAAKTNEELKRVAYAEVLNIIRDNEKAVTAGFKISTWMVEPRTQTVEIPGFRSMRITPIKVKEPKK